MMMLMKEMKISGCRDGGLRRGYGLNKSATKVARSGAKGRWEAGNECELIGGSWRSLQVLLSLCASLGPHNIQDFCNSNSFHLITRNSFPCLEAPGIVHVRTNVSCISRIYIGPTYFLYITFYIYVCITT